MYAPLPGSWLLRGDGLASSLRLKPSLGSVRQPVLSNQSGRAARTGCVSGEPGATSDERSGICAHTERASRLLSRRNQRPSPASLIRTASRPSLPSPFSKQGSERKADLPSREQSASKPVDAGVFWEGEEEGSSLDHQAPSVWALSDEAKAITRQSRAKSRVRFGRCSAGHVSNVE
ncbi:hypothetical protein AAFF_G00012900 [Aldrovandia affinis]|uniref:Uncharacterized protein n=1 Tax=Aldrovandia affinis TaxID=143900 RepID=A0AAD7S765_9TELE|nr:hypothetical protein AAFF_G00012900 [Aldrovandia affinis]